MNWVKVLATALVLWSGVAAAAGTFEEGLALKQQQNFEGALRIFREIAAQDPSNLAALEQQAILEGWTSRFDESAATWRRLIGLEPEKISHRIGLARVLYWKGGRDEALSELETVLEREPRNREALVLAGDVAAAGERPGQARDYYERAREFDPNNTEISGKIARIPEVYRGRIDLGLTFDAYAGSPRDFENGQAVQIGYEIFRRRFTMSGGLERLHHFSATDLRLNLQGYVTPFDHALLSLRVAATPDADFLARAEYGGEAEYTIRGRVVPIFGFRFLDYQPVTGGSAPTPTDTVILYSFGLRVMPLDWLTGEFRFGISDSRVEAGTPVPGSVACLAGAPAVPCGTEEITYSYMAKLLFSFRERWHPYLGFSRGEENSPPLGIAVSTVVSGGIAADITSRLGVRLDYYFEDRGAGSGGVGGYKLNSLSTGFTAKF